MSKKSHGEYTILGIDPGYADTGYGVIAMTDRPRYVMCNNIVTSRSKPFGERLLEIELAVEKLIREYKPAAIGLEKLFFFRNVTSAIDVAQARGIIVLAAARHHIPLIEFTPLQVKQSMTGNGIATKQQVATMVKAILQINVLPKKDDAIDALAIALCANSSFRRQ